MVAGMFHSSPSAILRIVPRRILPDRVLGSRPTTEADLKAATGPIRPRTMPTTSSDDRRQRVPLDPVLEDQQAEGESGP